MKKIFKYQYFVFSVVLAIVLFSSCKKFYNVDQDLNITESNLYGDWYEYRSAAMGLYGLQQTLVEQMLLLGELRGDLLTVTKNADPDMVEINNFNISKNNKYASPTNFFKLISACNNFIRIVKSKHPEVLNPGVTGTNFDRLYGEALCMRAWAYFNAARIYGKVPYIHEELSTMDEIEGYVNSTGPYKDSIQINFSLDGYHNDTIRRDTILTKQIYDLPMVIDVFTNQLERGIKVQNGVIYVGVDYAQINKDPTWEVTTWHPYGMHALLGQMYLTRGNLAKAHDHFQSIMVNNTISTVVGSTSNGRYDLSAWGNGSWYNIFTGIDNREHIYTIWFNKAHFQQNQLQNFFLNKYMLKPTLAAVTNWETCWRGQVVNRRTPEIPTQTTMTVLGFPGDYYRGFGFSYVCANLTSGEIPDYYTMLELKSKGDFRGANAIMDGMDTLVYKYEINKSQYAEDANYIVYRAAGIHLYMAEIYTYWVKVQDNGILSTKQQEVIGILNDGAFTGYGATVGRAQMGVRGRVGLGSGDDGVSLKNIIYFHDPFTNKITGYKDFSGDLAAKSEYLEDQVMNERALELAFEGERFYDLMRVANRRNDPSYLASRVSAKYPAEQRQAMYNLLMNPNNWYINYFN